MLTSRPHLRRRCELWLVPQLLNNKITVGNYFALQQGLNYLSNEDSISKGMAIAAAVTPTDTSAALNLIGVNDTNFTLFNTAPNKSASSS